MSRWKLAGGVVLLAGAFGLGSVERAAEARQGAACDNKCRYRFDFYHNNVAGGVKCYSFSLETCFWCTRSNSLCLPVTGDGQPLPHCNRLWDSNIVWDVEGCSPVCTTPVGSISESDEPGGGE